MLNQKIIQLGTIPKALWWKHDLSSVLYNGYMKHYGQHFKAFEAYKINPIDC